MYDVCQPSHSKMRVLVACDKFKDALTALGACETVAAALRTCHADWTVDCCPLADGGEGFVDVLTAAAHGAFESLKVAGPRGAAVDARLGWVVEENIPERARQLLGVVGAGETSRRIAVIEMAQASGLALLSHGQRDPWHTTSAGTGQMIRAAAGRGAAVIVLGIGGSATNDLGVGALTALGWSALDSSGQPVEPPTPGHWPRVHRFAGSLVSLPALRIACDVTNPLLGPAGATATYGPQKGLRAESVAAMEQQVAGMAARVEAHAGIGSGHRDTPGSGAAGGLAFGLCVAAGAQLVSGFELVSAWCDLDARLARADIVITGEGRFDQTSWAGKGPGAIARRAVALGKEVHVFAGRVDVPADPAMTLHAITDEGVSLREALAGAQNNLSRAVETVFSRRRGEGRALRRRPGAF